MDDKKMITDKTENIHGQDEARPVLNSDVFISNWDEFEKCIMQPGVTIMEWDIASDTLLYSKNQNGGGKFLCRNARFFPEVDMGIHTDDIPTLRSLVDNVMQGWLYSSTEFRIFCEEEGYIWYRIHVITLRDKDRKLLKAVGQLINIDKEKDAIDKLRFRAETDALTGVYNREQIETQIKQYLDMHPETMCAIFVIDTDNFKLVNDTQGHMLGDVVLTEMAAAMKYIMQGRGIVGRIGGDEFVIFMTNIKAVEEVAEKAEQLCDSFRELFKNEKLALRITCSMGISLYPNDGQEYKELFKHADEALYQAKILGKDRYCLFNYRTAYESTKKAGFSTGTTIESNLPQSAQKNDLLTDIFKLLYKTEDTDFAINMILEIVGKRFDVSRAYVFENTEDGKFCSNTYEWCNNGIFPEKDNLQNVDYSTLGNYEELYDENSIFYCRDINTLSEEQIALFQSQNIHSILQCAFWRNGLFAGFIGFDECTGLRLWTQEEVDVLSLVSQMMTTFLQKRRAMTWNSEMEAQIHTILDAQQSSCLYVIDQNTYEILYLGPRTKQLNPGIQLGDYCYEALFGRNNPCEYCPLMNGGISEADVPGKDIHIKTHASSMKWLGNDAYLLSYSVVSETDTSNRISKEESEPEEKSIVDCIQWLSSAEYLEDAINYVLEVVNDYYKADRTYIIEMDVTEQVANNTYEVCSRGIESQIDMVQDIPFEMISFWVEQFKAKGYIKIDDVETLGEDRRGEYEILKPQGITSLIAIPLYVKGGMSGFLGMDNPRVHMKNIHYLRGLTYFLENEIAKNALKKRLEQMSYMDSLTGLENRNSYMEFCDEFSSQPPVPTGIIFIDINGLKRLNDSKGHVYGDMMITHLSEKMNEHFPKCRKFRLSGDEFLIVAQLMEYEVFRAKLDALKVAMSENGRSVIAVGTTWSDVDSDLTALVHKADRLMYINKTDYYKQSDEISFEKMPLMKGLTESILNKRYLIYLQPKLNLKTGRVDSAEVLVRYRENNGMISSPAKFIPLLESEGLISNIDFFVLEEVCRLLTAWKNTGLAALKLALNFSKITLFDDEFFKRFWNIFKRYGLEPSQLELEVTETQESLNKKQMVLLLAELKSHGFSIALDDFGVEYSSYDFLIAADFDVLKIDKGIIRKLGESYKADLLLKHIVDMGHSIGILCCSEGVETQEQYRYMKEIGCDYIQGYLIDKPMPVDQFQAKYGESFGKLI